MIYPKLYFQMPCQVLYCKKIKANKIINIFLNKFKISGKSYLYIHICNLFAFINLISFIVIKFVLQKFVKVIWYFYIDII